MYIHLFLESVLVLILGCTASEYSVFDELGVQIGTVQHNLDIFKRAVKRDSDPSNILVTEDTHTYYSSKVVSNSDRWIEINPKLASNDIDKTAIHQGLSSQFRYAYNINLPFVFPYYGLPLRVITPTTGGFIFVGELIHNQLTETQYIAPLMAEFDPSLSESSSVFYHLTSTRAVVQWDNVYLRADKGKNETELEHKAFTFQAQLYINGDIIFAYKQIPYHPKEIDSTNHYVKIGIAEAYYRSEVHSGITVTFVHTFHNISIDFDTVESGTEVILTAETSCLSAMSCHACGSIVTNFNCSWCPKLEQCSDGFSRYREEWRENECLQSAVTEVDMCPAASSISLPSKHKSGAYEMQVCQGSKMALVCAGDDTLMVEGATFSRENYHGSMCEGSQQNPDPKYECKYDDALIESVLSKSCDGKSACFIEASENFFKSNPCPGFEMTLLVYYKCHGNGYEKVIIAIVVIVVLSLAIALGAWCLYAYKNPTSRSGLWLITYGRFWRSTVYKTDDTTTESGI